MYRQSDAAHVAFLHAVRRGEVSARDNPDVDAKLRGCQRPLPGVQDGIKPTMLYPHRVGQGTMAD